MPVLGRSQPQIRTSALFPAEGAAVGQEYIRIKDQNGFIWFWWIAFSLAPDWDDEPGIPLDQEKRLYIIPFWIKLADSNGDIWYIFPELDGSPTVSTTQPPVGDGITNSPKLRVRGGRVRYIYTIVGGMIDVAVA